ncbi:hypothetical protein ABZP36_021646 [Zizania latifolia]
MPGLAPPQMINFFLPPAALFFLAGWDRRIDTCPPSWPLRMTPPTCGNGTTEDSLTAWKAQVDSLFRSSIPNIFAIRDVAAFPLKTALEDSCFVDILNASAGQWPLKETQELAVLALKCAEMRRRDRPNLSEHVLPTLERLKDVASKAREMAFNGQIAPPSHFICPILQVVSYDFKEEMFAQLHRSTLGFPEGKFFFSDTLHPQQRRLM